jgi:hypothetical protein
MHIPDIKPPTDIKAGEIMYYPVLNSTQGLTDAYRNAEVKLSRIPLLPTQHLSELASPSCNFDYELHHPS